MALAEMSECGGADPGLRRFVDVLAARLYSSPARVSLATYWPSWLLRRHVRAGVKDTERLRGWMELGDIVWASARYLAIRGR